jgi:HAD superfamily hydrolase (TIGR01549 family)
MLKAVFFDLDDTLFDHKHSRRCGLKALKSVYSDLNKISIRELEKEHERLLAANYTRALDGDITIEDAMAERIRFLFSKFGLCLDQEEINKATTYYQDAYSLNRQSIPGVRTVLNCLKDMHLITGVISNGILEMQKEKLNICGISDLLDYVIVSEDVGIRKPDTGIFIAALQRINARSTDIAYIGDSWETDIVPANSIGIRTIWLNRYAYNPTNHRISNVITSYKPLKTIIRIIVNS